MKRFVLLVAFAAATGAIGAVACGPGNDKPPLTPDSEHGEDPDASAPSSSSSSGGSPATPPGK